MEQASEVVRRTGREHGKRWVEGEMMETEEGKQRELLGTLGPTSGSLADPIVGRMSTLEDAELWRLKIAVLLPQHW